MTTPSPAAPPSTPAGEAGRPSADRRPRTGNRNWYSASAAAFRWLHIYLSMLSFAGVLFFAATGVTLNHPSWFGGQTQVLHDYRGQIPLELLREESDDETDEELTDDSVQRLEVAEMLRANHQLRGAVKEFEIDEFECLVFFKGPGYAADAAVDRETGAYVLTEAVTGPVAIMNDLHKGRDSGAGWSWVIDLSAVLMILMSVSGFGLLFYLRKRRRSGIVTAVLATLAMLAVWYWWVP
ncbi:PepSY-associated TM helix domain-containing protein [Lignipirellula cremea]|uniref:PepSY-associated TM helix n=1 Tax=Lignipirellula cremea TaxID=2528010 RepID=A0A518DSK6_9BACT|nr:PepSY-associated TM helix domain-containing protein [Lignipirellula cremea]QDU94823.1 hypothetical protein Pla8534_26310 [Lignipirellula cremea]